MKKSVNLSVKVNLVEGVSKNNKDYAYLDLRIDNCPDFEPKPYWLSKMELNYIKAQLDLENQAFIIVGERGNKMLAKVTETISALLTAILGWFDDAFTGITGLFYDATTGFTLVGVFLLIGIALMLVMLVFRLIRGIISR